MYRGWMGNDFDERPDLDFMDREIEREMDEALDRQMELRADEKDEKLTRF